MTITAPPRFQKIGRRLAWLALFAGLLAITGWWYAGRWQPDPERWPLHGVAVGLDNAPINWPMLAATGAQFAYIDAMSDSDEANAAFLREQDRAAAAGLRVGVIYHFAMCRMASEQAAEFVTFVPRSEQALPAAVMVDDDPDCHRRPSRALLLSELTTFLNQVETHLGKPMLVSSSAAIEAEFGVGSAINRPLWVRRNWREPDAATTPDWVIWQASDRFRSGAVSGRLRLLMLNGAGL